MSYNYNKAAIMVPMAAMVSSPVKAIQDVDQTFLSIGQKLSNLAMMSMLDKNKQSHEALVDNEMI